MSLWKVIGTRQGKLTSVVVEADDYNAAVMAGSHAPHMLVVRDCVLVTDFTAEEISDAQAALDFHPSNSPYWDSRSAQDHLRVIQEVGLYPTTTEAERREIYRAARAQAEQESRHD